MNKAAVLDNNINTTVVLLRGFVGFREMEGNITPKGSVSFRDSDVEFLQTQAREWLEAMLGEKLEQEGRSLAEILANGAILYRVSQLMKELIRTKLGNNKNNNNIAPSDILHSPGSSKMLASPDIVVSKGNKNSQKYLPIFLCGSFLEGEQRHGRLTGCGFVQPFRCCRHEGHSESVCLSQEIVKESSSSAVACT